MSLYIVARDPGVGGSTEVAAVDLGPYQLLHTIKTAVAHLLEGDDWGTGFPTLMNSSDTEAQFDPDGVRKLHAELKQIVEEFESIPPTGLRQAGESPDPMLPRQFLDDAASNLADYFLAVDGKPALRALLELCAIADAGGLEIAFT